MLDLQKAGIFKRFSAFLCDAMAFILLALCLSLILSSVLGYDDYNKTIADAREKYAQEYDIPDQILNEVGNALINLRKSDPKQSRDYRGPGNVGKDNRNDI